MKCIDTTFSVLIGVLIGSAIGYAVIQYSSMPDVWFSYSTNECVEVVNYVKSDNYSCEFMPTKFHHVWVK